MSTTVLAKDIGNTPLEGRYYPTTAMVAYYDVPIPPRIPLHVGQRVTIHTLHDNSSSVDLCPIDQDAPQYFAQEAGVEGEITGIRTMEAGTTEFVVKNEVAFSDVVYAVLAIEHIQGVTVRLSAWKRLLRATVMRPLPETRTVPLELDAVVVPRDANGRTFSAPLCLACGMPSASDEEREVARKERVKGSKRVE